MTLARIALVLAAFLSAPAGAAIVAKPVDYTLGDVAFQGQIVYDDAAKSPRPGLVMVPDWMGMNADQIELAKSIAGKDYVIFVADIYGVKVRPKNAAEAEAATKSMYADRKVLRARVNAALDAMKGQAKAAPIDLTKLGAFGFCFGGATALDLGRSGADVAGIVSFHGNLSTDDPALAKNIKAKILVLHGADDKFESPEQIAGFQSEMRDANVDWQFHSYGGAVHCFAIPTAKGQVPGCQYNEKVSKRAFAQMHAFFAEVFGAGKA